MARWRGKVQLNIGFCLVRYPSPWSSSMARVPTALKTHKLSNSQSHSQSDSHLNIQTLTLTNIQTLTLKVSEKKRKREKKKLSLSPTSTAEDSRQRQLLVSSLSLFLHSVAVWGYRGFHFQALHSDPRYPLSLSLSRSLNAVVWSSLLLFVLLITNGCNFMKKKIPLKVGVCKFCIFMHKLILGFDPGIN